MAASEHSVFDCESVLFKPLEDLYSLKHDSIAYFSKHVFSYSKILTSLNKPCLSEGDFLFDMDVFLSGYLTSEQNENLQTPPLFLLAKSMPRLSLEDNIEIDYIPTEFASLSTEIECYIDLIMDVLSNQLSQKPYENRCDKENVTEKEHALQACKISLLLGMPMTDVLALLLHDIARPSINDPTYGHIKHSQEGSIILAPLGLPTDYAGYHTLAKYLLSLFCPPYKKLISGTSRYSLEFQKEQASAQLAHFKYDAPEIRSFFFKIMFMRLIDDMSKVPSMDLKSLVGEDKVYLDDANIGEMIKQQMKFYLNHLLLLEERENTLMDLEQKLDASIFLLSRAKEYSNHPEIYEKYAEISETKFTFS